MKTKSESIGSRLKNARAKLGLSLDEAYSKTKIHPRILEALEEDRGEEVLSRIYIKSFLKHYSDYLGLDTGELVKNTFPSLLVREPQPKSGQGIESKQKFLLLAVTVISIILLVWLVGYAGIKLVTGLWGFFTRSPVAVSTEAPAGKEAPVPVKAMAGFQPIARNEELVLELKAVKDVWIDVKSDGKTVFRRILPKGSVENWKAGDSIKLWLGKAEAVELTLNGQPLGSPGRGVIKNILITRKGMKIGK